MADTVRVKFKNPLHNYEAGGVYDVEEGLARRVIESGQAEETSEEPHGPQPPEAEPAPEGEYRASVTREGAAPLTGDKPQEPEEPTSGSGRRR